MSTSVVLPEGEYDHDWLSLLLRIAEAAADRNNAEQLKPFTIVPTQSAIIETYVELVRLRPDIIPLVDGDSPGKGYLTTLQNQANPPRAIITYGDDAAIECLAAWVLEPALASPGSCLAKLLPDPSTHTLKGLQDALIGIKKDRGQHEELAWEALENPTCAERIVALFSDIAAITIGEPPARLPWVTDTTNGPAVVYAASFITRV